MHAEWSVECGAEDPVIVVPWADPAGTSAFVDLRVHPEAIDSIPEAEAHPPLMQALRSLNAARSPVFTAKCDAWEMTADELTHLKLDIGIGSNFGTEEEASDADFAKAEADLLACGFASYIDCVCLDLALFASFPRHEHLLRTLTRLAARLDHPHAALEAVLRPAFVTLDAPHQGWAITLYIKGLGPSPRKAYAAWSATLRDAVALLRRS